MTYVASASLAALVGALVLTQPALAQTPVVAVNCGGSSLAAGGRTFLADQPYGPGGWGHVGGSNVLTSETRLGPVDNPYEEVVRRARSGFSAYRFDVPNGDYLVRLHLCDILEHGPGQRRFQVDLEGAPAILGLDVAARYGHDYAGVFTAAVTVADGRLDLEVTPEIGETLLGGIEVFELTAPLAAPPQPQGLTADWSYGANLVRWERNDDPGLVAWRIDVAGQLAGPFTPIALQWSQPARFVDRSAPIGVERFYRVVPIGVVVPGAFVEGPAGPVVSATARSSDQSKLPVYELSVAPADLAQLDALFQSDPDFEIPATLRTDGSTYAATLRYSGFTSADDPKKSLKLRFGAGDSFQGRREFNLKSHFSDDSFLRQELSRRMYLAAGHEAPRAAWVHVQLNGEFAGVFEELEVIEEDFLEQRLLPDGPIYQAYLNFSASMFPIDRATNVPYEKAYKKKTEKEQPYDDLVQFIDDLDSVPNSELRTWLATQLDVDDFLDFWAATCVVADIEKVLRDYHMYRNPDTGRWSVYTWDTDASWKQNFLPFDFGSFPTWVGEHQLAVRALSDPVWSFLYRRKVEALIDGAANPEQGGAFETLWNEQLALIADDVRADYHKYGWDDPKPFDDATNTLLQQVGIRRTAIDGQLMNLPAPVVPHAPWINEVMASNSATVTDPSGEFEDWVELANATSQPVDLGGYHLTDDPADPQRFTFPAGTILPADGYLVVWCDGDVAQPGLHASFGLSGAGEAVALFAPGGTELLDVLHFGPQRDGLSFARSAGEVPGAVWKLTADPTPGAPNVVSDNLPPWLRLVEHAPSAPGPADPVHFTAFADDEAIDRVELRYSIGGGPFQTIEFDQRGGGYFEQDLAPLGAGAVLEYWVRAVDVDGDETRFPVDAPASLVRIETLVPSTAGLRLNEVCADNDLIATDAQGQFEDFVEIFNSGIAPIDLTGHFLTDDLTNPGKWALPAGFVVQPKERVLVWCDGDVADGPWHASFSLSKSGEEIGLFRGVGVGFELVDGFAFGPTPSNTSLGPVLDGGTGRVRLFDPTPNQPNAPLPGGHAGYDSLDGSGAPLDLELVGSLALGQGFQLITQGAPLQPAILAIGFAPLNGDLGPGAPLLIDTSGALLLFGSSSGTGAASFALAVPALPALTGLGAFAQAVVGVQLTSAVHLVLGN
ncbi:Inner spore coat protein H [Planctomycetes bacterium Pla163]|uniref:Inner spore coat protein H n=1 Tax=Rohdeia mirabilis TaxID=2528008 RepID=A0A518D0G8_9BACT|nr:Inner spore coat protein H [Planctomycetes bacterium Pla163]